MPLNLKISKSMVSGRKSKYETRIVFAMLIICTICFSHFTGSASQESRSSPLEQKRPLDVLTHPGKPIECELRSRPKYDTETLWRWNYLEEHVPGYRVLVRDVSFDARLVNLIYTINSARHINVAGRMLDMGSPQINKEYTRLSAGPQVNNRLCKEQLSQMIVQLQDLRNATLRKRHFQNQDRLPEHHIRMARVLDSFGHYEGGSMVGFPFYLGTYSQCISTHLQLDLDRPKELTKMRHCTAKLDIDDHLNETLAIRTKGDIEMETGLVVGICIPESCHMANVEQNLDLIKILIDSQFQLPEFLYIKTDFKIDSIYCSPDADSQLSRLTWTGKILLIMLSLWFISLALATLVKQLPLGSENVRASWLQKHIQDSLDIRSSIKDLTTGNKRPANSKIRMELFDCIKVLTCSAVVFGHAFLVKLGLSTNLPEVYKELERDPQTFAIISGSLVTDTFFVITGIVVTYSTLNKLNKRWNSVQPELKVWTFIKKVAYIILSRYLRLVPPYAIIYWLIKEFFIHLHAGSTWDDGLNIKTMMGSCRIESWYTPLVGMATFKSLSRQCIAQAWSAASDMLFSFILAPLIVILTYKPRLGMLFVGIVSTLGSLSMYLATLNMDPVVSIALSDLKIYGLMGQFQALGYLYTDIRFRIASVLIGCVSGYALYHYSETGKIKTWPSWFKGGATKASIQIMVLVQTLPGFLALMKRESLETQSSIYPFEFMAIINSVGRLLWALSNAVILLRFVSDWKDGLLGQFSSSRIWTHLVKLNYCVLLLHVHVQVYESNVTLAVGPFSKYSLFSLWVSSYVVCLLLAVPFFVLVENPMFKLLRGIVDRIFLKQRQETVASRQQDKNHSKTRL